MCILQYRYVYEFIILLNLFPHISLLISNLSKTLLKQHQSESLSTPHTWLAFFIHTFQSYSGYYPLPANSELLNQIRRKLYECSCGPKHSMRCLWWYQSRKCRSKSLKNIPKISSKRRVDAEWRTFIAMLSLKKIWNTIEKKFKVRKRYWDCITIVWFNSLNLLYRSIEPNEF